MKRFYEQPPSRAEELFAQLRSQGDSAIDDFIRNRQAEELFLDFKRSADNGGGTKLHVNDRNNLAKAVAGFGNSEGGVIVWGVDASLDSDGADVARARVPIANAQRFVSWLQSVTSGCTIPPHAKVEHFAIPSVSDPASGFAATLIHKSNHVPHQSVVDQKYYIRAGSSFASVPHAVLAGMFGRRPAPSIFHMYTVGPTDVRGPSTKPTLLGNLGIMLATNGPAICRDAYVNVKVKMPGKCTFDVPDKVHWDGHFAFGFMTTLVARDGYKLVPGSFAQPLVLHWELTPPFTSELWIELTFGCADAPMGTVVLETSAERLMDIYKEVTSGRRDSPKARRIASDLFSIDPADEDTST